MELYHLKTFITVVEEGSISRAARRLSTTPSSVSMHIKALETEFDVQLFVRTNQGVDVTDKGKILAQQARQTLQSATVFAQQAQELRQQHVGTIRMGLNASPHTLKIPTTLAFLAEVYPSIGLELAQMDSVTVLDNLRADKLDIGYVYGDIADNSLIAHHLQDSVLVVAVPRAWEDRLDGSWEAVAGLDWIFAGNQCPFQPIMDDLFAQYGTVAQKRVHSNHDQTRFELVRAGVGVSLLEQSEAQHPDILIYDSLPMTCPLWLVYPAHRQYDPLVQVVVEAITNHSNFD